MIKYIIALIIIFVGKFILGINSGVETFILAMVAFGVGSLIEGFFKENSEK